ncbi:LOW QUALITY PROTEIN: hypothetical protein TorRG33x02_201630 [Trema orientale]|uniref:Uncharacterized protein n=1 Tax=Trema orientale TaxID=63057 RepID=A0A2P5EES1_TREOI|nr:LOW QUALITY PROTEIN: hypothetical protein TorRG33x02_201630 [Trema orientale]
MNEAEGGSKWGGGGVCGDGSRISNSCPPCKEGVDPTDDQKNSEYKYNATTALTPSIAFPTITTTASLLTLLTSHAPQV